MRSNVLTALFVGFVLLLAVGCGGGGDEGGSSSGAPAPNPEKAAKAKLPAFNADAKYNGKSALEYAASLNDLNPRVQMEALESISHFGVDGLLVREQVRALVDSARDDQVKVLAIQSLATMQAPEASAILRQKLADPNFSQDGRMYAALIHGARDVNVDEATLRADLLKIAANDPTHAATLMMLGGLPQETYQALAAAVFAQEHDDNVARYFLQNLSALTFVDDAKRVAYIKEHRPVAAQMGSALQPVLLQIGTDEAMDVALDLAARNGQGFAQHRYPVMIQFVTQGSVDPTKVMATMVEEVAAVQSQQQIDQITAYMESLVLQVRQAAQQVEDLRINQALMKQEITSAQAQEMGQKYLRDGFDDPRVAAVDKAYLAALNDMIKNGPSEMHQALAVSRLIGYFQRNQDVKLSVLEPAFAALADSSMPEIVRGTAGQQLQQSASIMTQRDVDTTIAMAVRTMWALDDAAAAPFVEAILVNAGRTVESAAAIVNAIAAGVDTHINDWSINSAIMVMLQVAIHGQLAVQQPKAKELSGIVVGKMLASKAAQASYMNHMLRSRAGLIMSSQTVSGLMGFIEPTVFADHKTVLREVLAAYTSQFLYSQPVDLKTDPQAKQKWAAFLQRIIDKKDPDFMGDAQIGMQRLPK